MVQERQNPTAATEETLLGVFRAALGLHETTTRAEMVRGTLPQWDSLGHMELVLEIEKEFGIHLADEEVLKLDTFDRALRLVTSTS